jgi:hypothetical protein
MIIEYVLVDIISILSWTSCDPFLQWLLSDVIKPLVAVVVLSSNGLG